MQVKRFNAELYSLAQDHPARLFFDAFVNLRKTCIGREISEGDAFDQVWWSECDQREWSFSGFMYAYFSFDLVLDGWLDNSPQIVASEQAFLEEAPRLERLLSECQAASERSGKSRVLEMIRQVRHMLVFWHNCIAARIGPID